jgi:aminoglycoside phosphotransferase (APT) family kinase protein
LRGAAPGGTLGEFLRALHDARVSAELPDDPMGRADMDVRLPRALDALAQIGVRPPAWLREADGLPRPAATSVVHGDLHFRHVLVDGGAISAVIDWGDVCRGDPSVDMSLYWSSLSPAGRADFVAAYGPVSDEQLLRARVLAVFLCAMLARYAETEDFDDLAHEARAGLERAM